MVYKALNDGLSMEFAETFLELWLIRAFLELWVEMEGKHVGILGCGLVILVTSVSLRGVAHKDSLHLIGQSQVVASGVANLMSRVEIVVCIGNSTWRYGWWFVIG